VSLKVMTVDSPQSGLPHIKQLLGLTEFCGAV
jgi:hypothetical protein